MGGKPNHKLRLELTTQSDTTICPDEGMPSFASEPCSLTKPQQETVPNGKYRIGSSLNLPLLPFAHFASVEEGKLPETIGDFERLNGTEKDDDWAFPLDWSK